jgi:hypothetical protein
MMMKRLARFVEVAVGSFMFGANLWARAEK